MIQILWLLMNLRYLMSSVREFVWSEVDKLLLSREGSTPVLGLAVSGGTDSRALLELMKDYPAELHIIHVDHGLRPSSGLEAKEVAQLAVQLGMEFHLYEYSIQDYGNLPAIGLEAKARMLRYRAFEDWLSGGDRLILLGHHADDQAETVLMNIFRGTHVTGLRGMPQRRDAYFRPLLKIRRNTLEGYLTEHKIVAIEDESNKDPRLTRNRVRHEIMPLLTDVFKSDPTTMLLRISNTIEEEVSINTALLQRSFGEYLISRNGIYSSIKDVDTKIVRAILRHVLPSRDLSRQHYLDMAGLLKQNEFKTLDLPHFTFASGWGYYTWGEIAEDLRSKLAHRVMADYPQVEASSLDSIETKTHNHWKLEIYRGQAIGGPWSFQVDQDVYEKLEWKTLEIVEDRRSWREKLKKLGVPAPIRERLPLCFLNNKLVWVPGFKISRPRAGDICLFWDNLSTHNAI